MWSPLPRERSGIADYSHELLAALADQLDVVAVVRDGLIDQADTPKGISVTTARAQTVQTTALPSPNVDVYQMGNHHGFHDWIHDQAIARPGIVVLHDTSLLDFYVARSGGIQTEAFREEVRFAHGPIWGDTTDRELVAGLPAVDVDSVLVPDRSKLTLERRIACSSRALIIHDPSSASWLQGRYPDLPVHVVPPGAPIRCDPGQTARARAELGFSEKNVVFGALGGISPIKRTLPIVLAFAELLRGVPTARLVIAGYPDSPEIVESLRAEIDRRGLAGAVRLVIAPPKEEFESLIQACDLVINLRWPTAGETSAVMMRAFGSGRAVVTSALPQHRHLDPTFCWQVPVEPASEARALAALLRRVSADRGGALAAGACARAYIERDAAWPVVARRYREIVEGVNATPRCKGRDYRAGSRLAVNALGDYEAVTGVAESARRSVQALVEVGVDVAATDWRSGSSREASRRPEVLNGLRFGKDHPVDLWLLNVSEFGHVPDHALDRYAIAYWFWELADVPDLYVAQVDRVDELWLPSTFVASAFASVTTKPITVIPCPVAVANRPLPRSELSLPEGCIVFFNFDASSSDARKNPWGVIEAFGRAFTRDERGRDVHLVLKVTDLERFPRLSDALRDAVASVGGIVISDDLPRDRMDELLAACDIYISLHRSEGFGLGMAEAMSLKKPVIATAYGGNVDFMSATTAALVGYELRTITEADHRFHPDHAALYAPGGHWAEPNLDQAARWLRLLAGDAHAREQLGERGASAIRSRCDPRATGLAMARRLKSIKHEIERPDVIKLLYPD